jgi:hypothetical protein
MTIPLKDILSKTDGKYLFVDIIMMAILTLNLGLILFDFTFSSDLFKGLFEQYTPGFYQFYDTNIHQDFLAIDLWFVSIFVIELSIRWIIAIRNQKYHRWFFYPFIHWYDVLGCIPLGSLRFLRVLRVVGLTVRLQKLGVIDLTKTYPFKKFMKYLGILTEEISDAVVIHVLIGIQEDIKGGSPVLDKIFNDLIQPHKEDLVEWMSWRLQQATSAAYDEHIDDLQEYIDDKITLAIDENREIRTISMIPVLGNVVTSNLEHAVTDVVNRVVDGCFKDLASPRNREVVSDVAHLVIETFDNKEKDWLNDMVKDIVVDSLELVKDQVKVQQWKIREEIVKEEGARETLRKVAEADYQDE